MPMPLDVLSGTPGYINLLDAANAYQGAERARMYEAVDGLAMRWCEETDRLDALKMGGG